MLPDDEIRVTYTMTSRDLLAAGVAASRRSVLVNAMGTLGLASGLLAIVLFGAPDISSILIAAGGALFLSGYLLGGVMAVFGSRGSEMMRGPVELTANADGLTSTMSLARTEARWTAYKRVIDAGTTLLLDLGTGASMLLPARVLNDAQRARLLGWVAVAGVLDTTPAWRPMATGIAFGLLALIVIGAVALALNTDIVVA